MCVTYNMQTSGVYQITSLIDKKVYIGSSYNIEQRIKKHISALNNRKHINRYLQNCWNKYGKDNFIFETLEITGSKQKDLFEAEQKWINQKLSFDRRFGFNLTNTADPTKSKLFNRSKKYIVISPEGEEMEVENLERFCVSNGLEKSSLHKVANGESYQHKGWYCRKLEDSHDDWLRKRKRKSKSGSYSGRWRIYLLDGSEIEVDSLTKWLNQNNISRGNLSLFMKGIRKKCKNIKNIIKIN